MLTIQAVAIIITNQTNLVGSSSLRHCEIRPSTILSILGESYPREPTLLESKLVSIKKTYVALILRKREDGTYRE